MNSWMKKLDTFSRGIKRSKITCNIVFKRWKITLINSYIAFLSLKRKNINIIKIKLNRVHLIILENYVVKQNYINKVRIEAI